jgi:hypothetical protein
MENRIKIYWLLIIFLFLVSLKINIIGLLFGYFIGLIMAIIIPLSENHSEKINKYLNKKKLW